MLRHILLASAACASTALWAGSVAAQTAASTATPPGPSAASPSTGNAPKTVQPSPSAQLNEVVVTAEKRTSTAQKTAASVDVVSSDTLAKQNIVQLQDLNQVLPSVQIEPLVNSVQFAIRGVQSNFIDPRAEPAVAASVNGLFFDRPLPFGFAFLDVSRVEALNGPAGTLYGRNAAGGAINIITNQPGNTFGGTVSAQGGNLGANSFTGVVNLPVNDTLSVRAAYGRDRRDGYISGLYDDIHTDTARLSLRWRPNEKLTVYLEGDYEHQGGAGTAQTYYPCNGAPAYSLVIPAGCERQLLGKPGVISRNGRTDSDVIAAQLHVDYDLGFATATSISGFVLTHQHFDFLPNGVLLTSERTHNYDYTQEFRLTGKDSANHQGGLAWQAGVFLFDSSGDFYQLSNTPFGNKVNQFPDLPQSSEAGFGQVTYGVTDQLRVTAGVRYTHDFKGLTNIGSFGAGPVTSTLRKSDYLTTYKGGLEYDLAPRNLLYANISTGYIAGGPSGGDPTRPVPANITPIYFLPEDTTAYEIGSKNRFFNNRLQINADIYYSYTTHLQITEAAYQNNFAVVVPNFALTVENLGSLSSYGVEMNATAALTPADRLSASLTYAQATLGASSYPTISNFLQPTSEPVRPGSTSDNVPQWTALLGYEHTWTLANADTLSFSVNSKLSTRYHLVYGSTSPLDVQSGFTTTDVGLNYTFHGGKYVVRGFAKNLENTPVRVYGEAPGENVYGILPPRTYGGGVTINF